MQAMAILDFSCGSLKRLHGWKHHQEIESAVAKEMSFVRSLSSFIRKSSRAKMSAPPKQHAKECRRRGLLSAIGPVKYSPHVAFYSLTLISRRWRATTVRSPNVRARTISH
jgi:hypothetical protein